jgi:hypothetical protein
MGGWVGRRDGLDNVEKRKFLTLPGLKLRSLGRPAHNLSVRKEKYINIKPDKAQETIDGLLNFDKGKVFPVLNEFKHYAMKAYGEVNV